MLTARVRFSESAPMLCIKETAMFKKSLRHHAVDRELLTFPSSSQLITQGKDLLIYTSSLNDYRKINLGKNMEIKET